MSNVNDTLIGGVSNFTMPVVTQVYSQIFQLTSGTTVSLDFKTLVNQNKIGSIQGVYVDNSQGTIAASVFVPATLQNFIVPPGAQGICPLYVTADNVVQISGNGPVTVIFNNFPTPAGVWYIS